MRGNPGKIISSPSGSFYIMYNNQPLLKDHDKIILHKIDADFNIIIDPKTEKQAITIIYRTTFNAFIKECKIIGMVD